MPLWRNSPGDIPRFFSDRSDVPLPLQRALSQIISFGLVIPDVTPKITCARAHLKSMTCSKQFYNLDIIRA